MARCLRSLVPLAMPLVVALASPVRIAVAQGAVTPMSTLRMVDSTSKRPALGDTVTITGRATLGAGVLDTGYLRIYVQDGGGGSYVRALGRGLKPFVQVGDSVVARGVVGAFRGNGELRKATIAVIAGPRRSPAALQLGAMTQANLDEARSRLVTISGRVVYASVGRGDHVLRVANEGTASDSLTVRVVDSDDGNSGVQLGRFELGDSLRVTGVLERTFRETGTRFTVYPRTIADVVPIGWTGAMRRKWAIGAGGTLAVALLLFIALRVRAVMRRERVLAEQALRESEARHRTLVERAPVGIVVYSNGRIRFANSVFASLIGVRDPQVLTGKRILATVHASSRRNLSGLDRRFATENSVTRAQEQFLRVDGVAIDVDLAATQTVFDGERMTQIVVHDATIERQLEAKLRQSQKLEMIGQLSAGIAHDFNNVLAVVTSYTEFVTDALPVGSPLREDMEEIRRAGYRGARLTQQLVSFSRRQVVQPMVMDLNDIIREVESLLRRTIGAEVVLEIVCAPEACTVNADRSQLDQVVMNLILNARDAMPAGGVLRVETSVVAREPGTPNGERCVLLRVRDSGVGMSHETLAQVFEPFFTTKSEGLGTGLGLATVHGIVTGAAGRVWAESRIGEGSTFNVALPYAVGILPPKCAESSSSHDLYCGSILLAEDEAPVRRALKRALERRGYRVFEATDGAHALLVWEKHSAKIDCVVTDLMMPRVRGPELIAKLRETRPDLPVVIISGYAHGGLESLDIRAANTVLLTKPFDTDDLLRVVGELTLGTTSQVTA